MLSLNCKNVQHVKIYLPCNFEVNPITHFGVVSLFSSNFQHFNTFRPFISPTWSEILLSSLSIIFIGCLLSHFDRSWSFIMETILWRMWRHAITWPLSSLKCIGQRSGRFQKVIINKMGVLGGYFQLRQCL
jgi:hypothetical protein